MEKIIHLFSIVDFFHYILFLWKECWSVTWWTRRNIIFELSPTNSLKSWLNSNLWLETSVFLYGGRRTCILLLKVQSMLFCSHFFPTLLGEYIYVTWIFSMDLCGDGWPFIYLLFHASIARYSQESKSQFWYSHLLSIRNKPCRSWGENPPPVLVCGWKS